MFTYFVFFCFGSTEKSANRRRQKHLLHLILRLYLLFPSFFSFRFFCSNLEHFGEIKEAIVKLRERVRKGHATLWSHPFIFQSIRCDVWVFRRGLRRMPCSSRKSVKMERNINEEGGEAAEAECEADGHKTL